MVEYQLQGFTCEKYMHVENQNVNVNEKVSHVITKI